MHKYRREKSLEKVSWDSCFLRISYIESKYNSLDDFKECLVSAQSFKKIFFCFLKEELLVLNLVKYVKNTSFTEKINKGSVKITFVFESLLNINFIVKGGILFLGVEIVKKIFLKMKTMFLAQDKRLLEQNVKISMKDVNDFLYPILKQRKKVIDCSFCGEINLKIDYLAIKRFLFNLPKQEKFQQFKIFKRVLLKIIQVNFKITTEKGCWLLKNVKDNVFFLIHIYKISLFFLQ